MDLTELARYDLGDFFHTGTDDPLAPGDFTAWKAQAAPAFSLFEPALAAGPFARTTIRDGARQLREINLASYSYLGLGQNPEVIAAAVAALQEFGTGACGSPMLSGMTVLHRELEEALARFLGREQTMLFNSGNAGAIGTLAAVLRKGDIAILDQYAHICLIEGARLAGARVETFRHNDPEDLDAKLTRHAGKRRLVVVEGLYSMHGDLGALDRLVPVARAHGVEVMVDEAHSILAVGEAGRGAAEVHGVEDQIALTYGTFSKSFANAGSVLAGSAETMDYIRYFANTYVFSVALPPAIVAGVLKALEVATRDNRLRETLRANSAHFRAGLQTLGIDTASSTEHIIPIVLGANRVILYQLTATLRENGLFVAPVDYPSVPENELRLRTCVSAAHTKADLDEALGLIETYVVPQLRR
ncbi:MAG: aminotransferase class I/II-fold pyridoxal phosphate-dependent enzyme [Pseudomonadota bacterium]